MLRFARPSSVTVDKYDIIIQAAMQSNQSVLQADF
jgi:hypothetical protein